MSPSKAEPLRILVAGGGVAGGLLGSWLGRQKGVSVRIVERVDEDDHTNAGNGLNVGPNGLRLLSIVWPDKTKALRSASLPWKRWQARYADGTLAYEIPLSEVSSESGIRIRWSELYRLARSDGRDWLEFGLRSTGASLTQDGEKVSVTLERGDGVADASAYDLVIVGEGRYSALRESIAGAPQPLRLGIANFRTLVDDRGEIDIDDMVQWFNGPARIIAFRLHDGLIYVSGNLPIGVYSEISEEMKRKGVLRAAYTPAGGRIDERLAALIERFCAPESVHHWARAQQIRERWTDLGGRVQYLGDAAHAMAPTLGQGATQAIEDAAAWMRLFRSWRQAGGDAASVNQLTHAFARLRTERIQFVKHFSEAASDVLLLGSDTESRLAAKKELSYRENLRRLYQDLPLNEAEYQAALGTSWTADL